MRANVITLLTDFGSKDPYVAAMKGVIISIAPHVRLVDITHEISKFNVIEGAFVLASAAKYFPKGTIHVGVVDPGVGTKRRAIIVSTKSYLFVGPDNGLLMLAANNEELLGVYEIVNPKYMLRDISSTFHGRDIFAPVAAHLANGVQPEEIGKKVEDYVKLPFPEPKVREYQVSGRVIYIDGFGNIVTNICREIINELGIKKGDIIHVKIGEHVLRLPFYKSYGYVQKGELLALIDSYNMLEIAVNMGNAAKRLKINVGDEVCIEVQ